MSQAGISLNGGTDRLDEYEEGTFTPELWDATLATDPTPPTYVYQVGNYRRIGNMVFVLIRVKVSALGSLTVTNAARIGGLPFTSSNITNAVHPVTVGLQQSMALPGNDQISAYVNNNNSYITLRNTDSTGGGTNTLISEFSANGDIGLMACYLVD